MPADPRTARKPPVDEIGAMMQMHRQGRLPLPICMALTSVIHTCDEGTMSTLATHFENTRELSQNLTQEQADLLVQTALNS